MGLKRQIETLREWACSQAAYCQDCKYVIHSDLDEYDDWCPFDYVIQAAEDRAKEGAGND